MSRVMRPKIGSRPAERKAPPVRAGQSARSTIPTATGARRVPGHVPAKHLSETHSVPACLRGALVDKAKYAVAIVTSSTTMKPIAIAIPICSSLPVQRIAVASDTCCRRMLRVAMNGKLPRPVSYTGMTK
jgi:hypothetical protein